MRFTQHLAAFRAWCEGLCSYDFGCTPWDPPLPILEGVYIQNRHVWATFWRGCSLVGIMIWHCVFFDSFITFWGAVHSGRFYPADSLALPNFKLLVYPRLRWNEYLNILNFQWIQECGILKRHFACSTCGNTTSGGSGPLKLVHTPVPFQKTACSWQVFFCLSFDTSATRSVHLHKLRCTLKFMSRLGSSVGDLPCYSIFIYVYCWHVNIRGTKVYFRGSKVYPNGSK